MQSLRKYVFCLLVTLFGFCWRKFLFPTRRKRTTTERKIITAINSIHFPIGFAIWQLIKNSFTAFWLMFSGLWKQRSLSGKTTWGVVTKGIILSSRMITYDEQSFPWPLTRAVVTHTLRIDIPFQQSFRINIVRFCALWTLNKLFVNTKLAPIRDGSSLLRSRLLDVTQRSLGGALRDIQKTAAKETMTEVNPRWIVALDL